MCANSLHTRSMARTTYGQRFASACDPKIFSNLIQLVVVFCALRQKSAGGKEREMGRAGEHSKGIYEVRQIFSGTLYQPKVPFCGLSRKREGERNGSKKQARKGKFNMCSTCPTRGGAEGGLGNGAFCGWPVWHILTSSSCAF